MMRIDVDLVEIGVVATETTLSSSKQPLVAAMRIAATVDFVYVVQPLPLPMSPAEPPPPPPEPPPPAMSSPPLVPAKSKELKGFCGEVPPQPPSSTMRIANRFMFVLLATACLPFHWGGTLKES